MKKTILLLLFVFSLQFGISQTLTRSTSQTILPDHSLACELSTGIIKDNIFYRYFKLSDFSITTSYDITSIDFGVEKLENAPSGGYPVTVQVYSLTDAFPTSNLTLVNQVTTNLQNQAETIINVPITATIPANDDFVIGISVPDGAPTNTTFQIGSNNLGESDPSYFSSVECNIDTPEPFSTQGRPDINMVINVNGNAATAGVGDLELVSFSYYPNPVKEKLVMRAKEEISSVEVFNILGQKVRTIEPSKLETDLDLTSLSSGTYMVRARVNDKIGSFKVVKE